MRGKDSRLICRADDFGMIRTEIGRVDIGLRSVRRRWMRTNGHQWGLRIHLRRPGQDHQRHHLPETKTGGGRHRRQRRRGDHTL